MDALQWKYQVLLIWQAWELAAALITGIICCFLITTQQTRGSISSRGLNEFEKLWMPRRPADSR